MKKKFSRKDTFLLDEMFLCPNLINRLIMLFRVPKMDPSFVSEFLILSSEFSRIF